MDEITRTVSERLLARIADTLDKIDTGLTTGPLAGESVPPGPEWRSRGVTRGEVCAAFNVDLADLQQEIDRQHERDRLMGIGRADSPISLAGRKGRKRARKLSKHLKRIADTLDVMADKHERLFREVLEIREGTLSLAGSLLARNEALDIELRELRARLGEKEGGE